MKANYANRTYPCTPWKEITVIVPRCRNMLIFPGVKRAYFHSTVWNVDYCQILKDITVEDM